MFRYFIILSLLSSNSNLYSQDIESETIIENTITNDDQEFLDNETITEDYLQITQNKININDSLADYTPLLQYGVLSPIQVQSIKSYIQKHGSLLTEKELFAVPNISYQEAQRLWNFISIGKEEQPRETIAKEFLNSKKSLILRAQRVLEKQKAYIQTDSTASKFLGKPNKLYVKYRQVNKDRLSFGFLADQDSGEEFFTGTNRAGFDFYSAHITYKPKNKWMSNVALGDYEVKLGQGLMIWNGFRLGKGVDPTAVFQKGNRLRAYTSSNEYNFLRGMAIEIKPSNSISNQLFISRKKTDAHHKLIDSLANKMVITSLQTSGLHRTSGEIRDKGSAIESILGVNTDFQRNRFTLGTALLHYQLSDSLAYSDFDYQKFYPRGKSMNSASIHHAIVLNRNYVFGETVLSDNQSWATIQGLQHFFKSGVQASLVFRHYEKDYQNRYASAFSENTRVTNETGLYLGLKYAPTSSLSINSYFDYFHFPWNKFRVSKPSNGNEWFLQSIFTPNDALRLELRTKWEQKEINEIAGSQPSNRLLEQNSIRNRLELIYSADRFTFKSRIAHSQYKTAQKNEHGYVVFQDIKYTALQHKIIFFGRLSIFNTPSYDSRIYAYENDLLYTFTVPALYQKGVKYYALINVEPIDRLKFWIKISRIQFANLDQISSGYTQIDGNHRTDAKIQLQYKFR